MGLQEKQAWVHVNEKLNEAIRELNEASGASIHLKLVEESFKTKELIERIPDAVLNFLVDGIKDLCKDNLAKEAVQSAIKAIQITQSSVEAFQMTLKENTLQVIANFDANGMSGLQYPHSNDYGTFLTKEL